MLHCRDTDSGEDVPILGTVENKPSFEGLTKEKPVLVTLNDNRADYVTFTTADTPRPYEFMFDPSRLQPGCNYTTQCDPWALGWWSHDTIEQCLDHYDTHGELPPTESPSLPCKPINEVSLGCRQDMSGPPRVDVSLAAGPELLLSENPPLKFFTTFTSHATKPITVLAQRANYITTKGDIELIDPATGRHVAPDLIDFRNDDGTWRREDFLVLTPTEPYVEERVLNLKDGLDVLQPEKDYILRFPQAQWKWWSFDSIDEVMQQVEQRGATSLGDALEIDLVCHDEVKIRVLE